MLLIVIKNIDKFEYTKKVLANLCKGNIKFVVDPRLTQTNLDNINTGISNPDLRMCIDEQFINLSPCQKVNFSLIEMLNACYVGHYRDCTLTTFMNQLFMKVMPSILLGNFMSGIASLVADGKEQGLECNDKRFVIEYTTNQSSSESLDPCKDYIGDFDFQDCPVNVNLVTDYS